MRLSLEHVCFSYQNRPVINDISLTFEPGRIYSILGPNGCGKTTLLSLMIRQLVPDSGEIYLDSTPLERLTRNRIARSIALVSQQYGIAFPFSVEEVVTMGRHPYIPRLARPSETDLRLIDRAMETAGITEFKDRRITELSGGETQRCVFARTLCQDTPVLLLDEAFSNMDVCHTLNLLERIRKEVRSSGKTVVSVFHDINLAAAWSDDLIFLKDGRIAAAGMTEDILTESVVNQVFHVESSIGINVFNNRPQVSFKVACHDV